MKCITIPAAALFLFLMNTFAYAANNSVQNSSTDPIEIILQDHTHIRESFAKLDKILDKNVDDSRRLFKVLENFLAKHEVMEESLWYPELEKHEELKKIIADLKDQEKEATDAMKELDSTSDNEKWVKGVKKLYKDVEKHATAEEDKLFPKVRKLVNQQQLNNIGAEFKNYKSRNNQP